MYVKCLNALPFCSVSLSMRNTSASREFLSSKFILFQITLPKSFASPTVNDFKVYEATRKQSFERIEQRLVKTEHRGGFSVLSLSFYTYFSSIQGRNCASWRQWGSGQGGSWDMDGCWEVGWCYHRQGRVCIVFYFNLWWRFIKGSRCIPRCKGPFALKKKFVSFINTMFI